MRLLLCTFTAAISASHAGTVISDFNDLSPGELNEAAGQPADTGIGFTESFWPLATGVVIGIAGDLTPPAGSNYISGQTGTGLAIGNSFGSRVRRLQSRSISPIGGDSIWLSALFSLNGNDTEGSITFNGLGQVAGGVANGTPAISFGDNGTPGAIGTLLPSEDALANIADTSRRLDNAVVTDGTPHLLVAKISIAEGDDTISLWLDPLDVTDEASLGVPTLTNTAPYFTASIITDIGIEVVREDDPTGNPTGGLILIDNLKISDAPNAFDIVTKAADPIVPAAELVVTAQPTFPNLYGDPSTASSTLTLSNIGDANDVQVTGLQITGDGASAFSSAQVFPINIASGASADITIDFDSSEAVGPFSATIEIQSDAPNSVPNVPLFTTYYKDGANTLTNFDFEADAGALPGWSSNAAGTAAGIAPGSTVSALISDGGFLGQTLISTGEWFSDFYFVAPDTTLRAFNVRVGDGTGQFNIRYRGTSAGADNTWNAYDSNPAGANDLWGAALALPPVQPGAVYFMQIVGHDWGGASPSYDIFLSAPNSTALTSSVLGLTRFQGAAPVATPTSLLFTAQYSDGGLTAPGYTLDDVRFINGLAPPIDFQPVITNLVYDSDASSFSFNYTAQPGAAYSIQKSSNLLNWIEIDDPTASGSVETHTDFSAGGTASFYRVTPID